MVCLLAIPGDSMRAEVEHACHILLVCNRGSSGIAARESDHTNQYMSTVAAKQEACSAAPSRLYHRPMGGRMPSLRNKHFRL